MTPVGDEVTSLTLTQIDQRLVTSSPTHAIEVNFRPDPNLWDGRFANNGWLQECPKPLNKLTWDNAVLISPALAQRYQLTTNDVVELNFRGRSLRAPVWVMPGQAEDSLTLHLGHGRERVGRVGAGVGFNAYLLRASDALWSTTSRERIGRFIARAL